MLAEIALREGHYQEALSQALHLLAKSPVAATFTYALRLHLICARACSQLKEYCDAESHYQHAINLLELLTGNVLITQRSGYLFDKDEVYYEAIDLADTVNKSCEALGYLEKARSSVSQSPRMEGSIQEESNTLREAEGKAKLQTLLQQYRQQSKLVALLQRPGASSTRQDEVLYETAKKKLARLERHIRSLQESRLPLGGGNSIIDFDPVHISSPTVSYACLGDDVLVFFVHKGNVISRRVSGAVPQIQRHSNAVQQNIRRVTHILTHNGASPVALMAWERQIQAVLTGLWSLLIAPIAEFLPQAGSPLTIVPHGILHALPLGALYHQGRYLAAQYQLQFGLSCQGLRTPSPPRTPHRPPLVVGFGDGVDRLAHVTDEAQEVAALLGGDLLLGEAATSVAFIQQAADRPILHMAAHGEHRLDLPNSSYLWLADGPIHPLDLTELDLRGCHLVTLSACETALTQTSGGDDQIGLTSAFFRAGAAHVLATLWQIEDHAAQRFMGDVYRTITRGGSFPTAVQAAQLACLSEGTTDAVVPRTHPYFWAAFHLLENAAVFEEKNDTNGVDLH